MQKPTKAPKRQPDATSVRASPIRYPPAFAEVVADDPEGFYRWNLARARDGCVSSANEMLHGFCTAVQDNKPIPKPILDYLDFAFAEYLQGAVPIAKALCLNRPANRPRNVVTVDPVRAVATVYLLMKRDGMRKGKALETTCKTLGLSRRNLERYDTEWNLIRDFEVADLQTMSEIVAGP